jgi:hypothetical protein
VYLICVTTHRNTTSVSCNLLYIRSNIQVRAFLSMVVCLLVTLYGIVTGLQRFGGTYCLLLQGTVLQPRKDHLRHSHRRENLKPHKEYIFAIHYSLHRPISGASNTVLKNFQLFTYRTILNCFVELLKEFSIKISFGCVCLIVVALSCIEKYKMTSPFLSRSRPSKRVIKCKD